MDTKNLLVIRVRGIIDHKRSKELTKIYKEQLGEQPFIIIDDEVREIEPFYDYREHSQTEEQSGERFVSVFEKVQVATDQYAKQGYSYTEALNKAREENGIPKLDEQEITYNVEMMDLSTKAPNLPNSGIVPLIFEEGKVADVKIVDGEIKGVYPGGPIKDLDSLMNAGKVEITQDGGKPLGEE